MRHGVISAAILICCVFFLSVQAFASEEELMKEIRALQEKVSELEVLKARIAELEKQVGEQKCAAFEQQGSVKEIKEALMQTSPENRLIKYSPGEGVELGSCGFKIQAGATFIFQGTPNANGAGDKESSRYDASWSSDIYIEKAFDDWGLALLHLEPGQGDALEGDLSVFSNVNRDSNDTGSDVPITELFYEHYLFNKQLVITVGKMDPANYVDQNEYAFDETTQFLGRVFRNSPAIEWPDDNTLGAAVTVAPSNIPYMLFSVNYFNTDNSWENIFDKIFISTQITFMPEKAFGWEEKWSGNYRVYWWFNGLDHAKLVDQGEPSSDQVKERNMGVGLSFDQKMGDIFGIFSRFGFQRGDIAMAGTNPNTAACAAFWTAGIQATGESWKRPDDVIACSLGQIFPDKKYKDAGNGGAAEGHAEVYYRFQLNSNIAISPDFQFIWNPNGISHSYQGDNDLIFVYGVRGQLDF